MSNIGDEVNKAIQQSIQNKQTTEECDCSVCVLERHILDLLFEHGLQNVSLAFAAAVHNLGMCDAEIAGEEKS